MTFLKQIQMLLERTYAPTGIDLEECLIGRRRFEELSALVGLDCRDLSQEGRTFLRVLNGRLYLAIYYHPEVIKTLEKYHPGSGLNQENIRPLIVFVEELDHAVHAALLFLENRLQIESEDLLCDLELQAKVDTYLALQLIVATLNKNRNLNARQRSWLRKCLFHQESYDYERQTIRDRYYETNKLGRKLVFYLDRLDPEKKIEFIRQFRPLSFVEKRSRILSLRGM